MTTQHESSPPTPSAASGWRSYLLSWVWRLLRLAIVSYLAVCGFLYFAQTWLIFPGHDGQGKERTRILVPPGAELTTLTTNRGVRLVALFGVGLAPDGTPLPDGVSRPTILFFYGNADCAANNRELFEDFRKLGANVLIPEYVGFGMSDGSPSEQACYETADAAWDYLAQRPDVDLGRIVVAGWSLGSAVAVDLAARRPAAGLVIFSSFTSMVDMGRHLYPVIPVSWLLKHRFESEAKISRVACPILIGHGRRDRAIPFAMSERLAEAAGPRAELFGVDDADHNDFFLFGGRGLLDRVRRFLEKT